MTELPLRHAVQKSKINDLYFITDQMKKFKLAKEKWYFQSLRETKSVKELDDWAVEISWYASTKDKDRWWDIVEPKAFQSALERYMTNPIVLLQHKTDKPIWIVESADIDDNWLFIKAKISQNTDWVIDLIKNWVLRAFSIWYSIKDYETDVRELADWTYDMTNIIKDLELYEISVVSVPMNPYALSKSVEDLLEVEESEEQADEEVADNVEEEKVEEAETVEEEKVVENDEEKSVEDWSENEQSEEQVEEWTDVQEEEKIDESESEEAVEEEHPNEEVETKEMSEEENEKADESNEEEIVSDDDSSDNQEADENSEISDEEAVEEDSENAVETQANDEEVVETHNDEVVETKSIETESQKQFDFKSEFAMLQKSFDEKLAEKDEKIKSLESKVETMTKLFAESVETIDRMATAVKNTPVNSGLQYKRPLKKWWYYDVASIIKSL